MADEFLDVVDELGAATGERKHRKQVHKDGDWHRCAHVWLYVISTEELLVQKRSEFKDSWAGKWDISAAGHVKAGSNTVETAIEETFEELGIKFPKEAFEPLFTSKVTGTQNDGAYVNNEFADIFLVTVKDRIPVDDFELDEAEVDAVKYIKYSELEEAFLKQDPAYIPADLTTNYKVLFDIIKSRSARKGLVGSGSYTFFHQSKGQSPVQIQCVTFDEAYLKIIPADKR